MAIKREDHHQIILTDTFQHDGSEYVSLRWDSDRQNRVEMNLGGRLQQNTTVEMEPVELLRLKNFFQDFDVAIVEANKELSGG